MEISQSCVLCFSGQYRGVLKQKQTNKPPQSLAGGIGSSFLCPLYTHWLNNKSGRQEGHVGQYFYFSDTSKLALFLFCPDPAGRTASFETGGVLWFLTDSNANLVVKNNCLQVKDAKSNHLAVILFIKKKLHGKFGFFFLSRFLNSLDFKFLFWPRTSVAFGLRCAWALSVYCDISLYLLPVCKELGYSQC